LSLHCLLPIEHRTINLPQIFFQLFSLQHGKNFKIPGHAVAYFNVKQILMKQVSEIFLSHNGAIKSKLNGNFQVAQRVSS